MVMDVDSMKTMYTQYLFQEKRTVYLDQVNKDLQTSITQLNNTAVFTKGYQRRESLPIDAVHTIANNTKNSIRRVSDLRSRKKLYPLILILEGIKMLVSKLHTGSDELANWGSTRQQDEMVTVENRLILLLTQLGQKTSYLKGDARRKGRGM